MPFPVCLCLRKESPCKRLSPDYLTHWLNGGGLGSELRGGGVKKTERVNDGGRESRRPLRDNSPGVGSFTDTGNA